MQTMSLDGDRIWGLLFKDRSFLEKLKGERVKIALVGADLEHLGRLDDITLLGKHRCLTVALTFTRPDHQERHERWPVAPDKPTKHGDAEDTKFLFELSSSTTDGFVGNPVRSILDGNFHSQELRRDGLAVNLGAVTRGRASFNDLNALLLPQPNSTLYLEYGCAMATVPVYRTHTEIWYFTIADSFYLEGHLFYERTNPVRPEHEALCRKTEWTAAEVDTLLRS